MKLKEFTKFIQSTNPKDIVEESLHRDFVHAIPDTSKYKTYIANIKSDYPQSVHVAIMGSGNWKYSLNPYKNFSEYHIKSDIDIVIICPESYKKTWDELRVYHRKNFYFISDLQKQELLKFGENVYSGFICPKWIPGKSSVKLEYALNTNKYSNEEVAFRNVNMMYFKNMDEALDYYIRGFRLVKIRN